jgi:hypothetical protein
MPGGALVEIVIVLLFVFVTMSAIVSSGQELLFQIVGVRSGKLRKTVQAMLCDEEYDKEVWRRVYYHPLIAGVDRGKKRVTWIKPESFALALAHAVQPADSRADPLEDMPNAVDALRDGELKRRLQHVLPPAGSNYSRGDIQKALAEWFETAARKTGESYKSDATAASYVIAAIAVVTLNVSPIEITQRLMADDALRTTFASAVPDLAPMLFNPGEGVSFSTPAANSSVIQSAPLDSTTIAAPPANASFDDFTRQQQEQARTRLGRQDIERMLTLYKCAESRLSLPIGWEWMAETASSLGNNRAAQSMLGGASETQACERAIASADTPALKASLTQLQLTSDTSFERQYGPNFETDNPLLVIAGWLIMMIAAAQGAPFWFDLIKKFIQR